MDIKTNYDMNMGLLNAQSVCNKLLEIRELVYENRLDIFALTETWLSGNDSHRLTEMTPSTHSFYQKPRADGYGGVGILLSKKFSKIKIREDLSYESFESLVMDCYYNNIKFVIVVVYRSPRLSKALFVQDFYDLLDALEFNQSKLVICGDFNLAMDDNNNFYVKQFLNVLDIFNLSNLVHIPTSRGNHIIDLIIQENSSNIVKGIDVAPDFSISDHKLVTCKLAVTRDPAVSKVISYRVKSNFDPFAFVQESFQAISKGLKKKCNCMPETSVESCIDCFVNVFVEECFNLYDKQCPLKEKIIYERDFSPWFNSSICQARKKRRVLERKWRTLRTDQSRKDYNDQRNVVNYLIKQSKKHYYRTKIEEAGTDVGKLYVFFNQLLGKTKERVLPSEFSDKDLAEGFSNFFIQKIDNIFNGFTNSGNRISAIPDFPFIKFSKFKKLCPEEVGRMIKNTRRTFCSADPFPLSDVICSENSNQLIKIYTDIINVSLQTGKFPSSEKMAIVKPLLKGKLDPESFSSYRPVSNLSFLSKIIELSVLSQLKEHLDITQAIPVNQSAYRKNFSTETALCSIVNDLLFDLDKGKCCLLILLDLTAAFDTVMHDLLIEDLILLGLSDIVLDWFRSYLSDRQFHVSVGKAKSDPRPLLRGVPQGSVLGPLLFSVYTTELSWILKKYNVSFKLFADDTQFYFAFEGIQNSEQVFSNIVSDIKLWMDSRRLKLNEAKTVCIPIGTRFSLKKIEECNVLKFNDISIEFSDTAKNLGVIFDRHLSFDDHILSLQKKSIYDLRKIAHIKKHLDNNSLRILVNNLIVSRLDYCNCLFAGLPNYQLMKIQKIFNRAARLITGHPFRERITPVLIELHWLPVKARIFFKICTLTYRTLKEGQPQYLLELLVMQAGDGTHTLRSALDPFRLVEPRVNRAVGERAFGYCAPRFYNSLPVTIKESATIEIFRKRLKTITFERCYDLHTSTIKEEFRI